MLMIFLYWIACVPAIAEDDLSLHSHLIKLSHINRIIFCVESHISPGFDLEMLEVPLSIRELDLEGFLNYVRGKGNLVVRERGKVINIYPRFEKNLNIANPLDAKVGKVSFQGNFDDFWAMVREQGHFEKYILFFFGAGALPSESVNLTFPAGDLRDLLDDYSMKIGYGWFFRFGPKPEGSSPANTKSDRAEMKGTSNENVIFLDGESVGFSFYWVFDSEK